MKTGTTILKHITLAASIVLLFVPFTLSAQKYNTTDSIASRMKAATPEQLAKSIAARFSDPEQRVRAIFTWMATHIDYDVSGFYNSSKLYNPQWPSTIQDSMEREQLFTKNVAQRVFREKRGICAGYSKLFMYLSSLMGIETRSVIGWGKTEIGKMGARYRSNHEWNLVKINGKWYPVDVTWAAGYTDFGKGKFIREFNDHYFMTDPGLLLVDHYPEYKADALLSWVPSFEQFITRPMVYRDFWKLHPTAFNASSGLYKFSDTAMTLFFTTPVAINIVQIVTTASNKQEAFYPVKNETVYNGNNYVSYTESGKMKIRFRPSKSTDKKAIVFINGHAVMEFLISN